MDPVTAIANAITAGFALGTEWLRFLQTPQGQELVKAQVTQVTEITRLISEATQLLAGKAAGK